MSLRLAPLPAIPSFSCLVRSRQEGEAHDTTKKEGGKKKQLPKLLYTLTVYCSWQHQEVDRDKYDCNVRMKCHSMNHMLFWKKVFQIDSLPEVDTLDPSLCFQFQFIILSQLYLPQSTAESKNLIPSIPAFGSSCPGTWRQPQFRPRYGAAGCTWQCARLCMELPS